MATPFITGKIAPISVNLGTFGVARHVTGTLQVSGKLFDILFVNGDRVLVNGFSVRIPSVIHTTQLSYRNSDPQGTSLELPRSIFVNGAPVPWTLRVDAHGVPNIDTSYDIYSSDLDDPLGSIHITGTRDALTPIATPMDIQINSRPTGMLFRWLGDYAVSLSGYTTITSRRTCPQVFIECSFTAVKKNILRFLNDGINSKFDVPNPFKNFRSADAGGRMDILSSGNVSVNRRNPIRQVSVSGIFTIIDGFTPPKYTGSHVIKPGVQPSNSSIVNVSGDKKDQSYGHDTRIISFGRKTESYRVRDVLDTEERVAEFVNWLYTVEGRSGVFYACDELPLGEVLDVSRAPGGYSFSSGAGAGILKNGDKIIFSGGHYNKIMAEIYNKNAVDDLVTFNTNTDISKVFKDKENYTIYKASKYRLASDDVKLDYFNPAHVECSLELVKLQYQD